jgi:peptide deformylase
MTEEAKREIKIFQIGEKVLAQKAKKVPVEKIREKKFQNIIEKMKKVVSENKEAIAVAAPQIGEPWRIFVVSKWVFHPQEKKGNQRFGHLVFVNPEIIEKSKDENYSLEGCLSVPGLYGNVLRSEKIKIEAFDERAKKLTRQVSGLLAQVVQHETDHLNGVLFCQRTSQLYRI